MACTFVNDAVHRAPPPALGNCSSWRCGGFALAVFMLMSPAVEIVCAAASVDDLTGPWQLLVDDFPVASKTNVTRAYHAFQKYGGNPVLIPEQPWEQPMVYLYGTVLPDEIHTGYRMWYHTLRTNNSVCTNWSNELYATSPDGIHWTKSALSLRSTCGSASNNMYFTRSTSGGVTSVIQTPSDPDPTRLYKFMNYDSGGYYAAWSPDGIHVTDAPNSPVFAGGSDVGQFCWDPHTQLYRGYVKNAWYDWSGLKRRAVALTTTTNIAFWPTESLILWPDAFDDRWAIPGSVQRTHFYGLSAFPYESMYIGFLWIFRATELDGEMPGYLIGPCFVELVSSHDGVHWTREEGERPPVLPLGPNGAWDDGMVFTARAPVVEGDTIKVWYGGFDQVHGTALTKTKGAIGLATMRKDGFASLDAGAIAGSVETKPLSGAAGALQVNYRAATGSLKVEVLDQNYNVVPGYSQTDCVALTGDSVAQTVVWQAHSELPPGAPTLRLRFILQNASLYSFMAGQSAALVDVPIITQQPVSQTVIAGGAASFTTTASAISPLSYRWQNNEANLSDDSHYSGFTTTSLTIVNVDGGDAGSYCCVVTNAYGSVTSAPATLTVVANPFGQITLMPIPTLVGDSSNEGRALSPDGQFVVGLSGANNGFVYDSISNRVVRPVSSDGAAAQVITGIGYRIVSNQVPPETQVVLSGLAAGSGRFTVWMTTNRGVTWGKMVQYPSGPKKPTVPISNGLVGTASDAFYSIWTDEGTGATDNWGLRVGRFSGTWPMTPVWNQKDVPQPDTCQVNGVSSTGRALGWRRTGATGTYANYVADWKSASGPAIWNVYGLDGTTAGQAFSVSADGTIVFGISPLVAGGATNRAYKAAFSSTYPGPATQHSTDQIPDFAESAGSANLAVPYGCTLDGRFAVGASYRGGIQKAVLWDTGSATRENWTITDLTDLALTVEAPGIFARLTRAYSIATNTAGRLVITGVGVDTNNPAGTRAFLMTVGKPALPDVSPPSVTISGSYPAGFTFSFPTVASGSVIYYLECTTNLPPLTGWNTIASRPGNGAIAGLSDLNPLNRQCFYRIRIQ